MQPSGERLLERLDELPSLPAIYHQARNALERPDGSLDAVASVLETDTALSARILRVANSALYGLVAKVESLPRALTMIGTEEVHRIILATSVVSVFRDIPLGAVSMRSFWEHSIATGVASRAIARRLGQTGAERFYLAGLLHDIGRLPLYLLEPETMGQALQAHREHRADLQTLEAQMLGTTHTEVGAALLTQWQIPAVYCEAAGRHHDLGEDDYRLETSATHVADIIANSLRIGTSGTRAVPVLSETHWRRTGLEVDDLRPVVELTLRTTQDVVSAFLEL
ncbi:MAG: HDOD domain-containing protein [Gammaproteobacteria bacterium]|jgi:putative nucleotidyltransferase with HDIG domain|nr:HDOD domain-containing protein [Gammaproteobacteria bacterium]